MTMQSIMLQVDCERYEEQSDRAKEARYKSFRQFRCYLWLLIDGKYSKVKQC